MKIAIFGYSGSGKSTLARFLGQKYCIPVLHLDTVNFNENWQERPLDQALKDVVDFMLNTAWVIDGNYKKFLRNERFQQADFLIFLDFNRFNCFFRALRRYFRYRGQTRECMAQGCIEKFDWEFVRWILYESRTRKRKKQQQEILQTYSEKAIIIKNQKQLNYFMQNYTQILQKGVVK